MFYQVVKGESNVPGAAGNLRPGGLLAAGVPAGQNPLLPMSQADFQHYMGGVKLDRLLGPIQEQRGLQRFHEIMRQGVPGASMPGGGGTPMGNAGLFGGPQLGQAVPPVGFDRISIS
jgi:hypothetical protein